MMQFVLVHGFFSAAVLLLLAVGAAPLLRRYHQWKLLQFDILRYSALTDHLLIHDEARVKNLSPAATWTGFRSFRIARKVVEAKDIVSFYITPHDQKPIVKYVSGQFLTCRFFISGEKEPSIRCYTISRQCSDDEEYRLTVKLIRHQSEKEDDPKSLGKVSHHLHNRLSEGSIIEVAPPAGQFTLSQSKGRPVVFVAGGIGVTPFCAMMEELEEHEPNREAWLFYGDREPEKMAMAEFCRNWADNRSFHFVACYSQLDSNNHELQSFEVDERVSADLLQRYLPSLNYEFYFCGPPDMMGTLGKELLDLGVPSGSMHFEAFAAESVQQHKPLAPVSINEGNIQVSFRNIGKQVSWDPECNTILELAEKNSIYIPSGCRAGNCGTCAIPVLSGSFRYVSHPATHVDEGKCLACISSPIEDMEIA